VEGQLSRGALAPGRQKGRKADLGLETFEDKRGVLDFGPILK
jgi:hypothetical protein